MARGRAYSLDFRIAMMKQHAQGRSFSTLSRETDVPRDVLRRWWSRYRRGGEPALRPRSRRPRRSPTQVPAATEAAILALRTQGLGPARIALDVAPTLGGPATEDDGRLRGPRFWRGARSGRIDRGLSSEFGILGGLDNGGPHRSQNRVAPL